MKKTLFLLIFICALGCGACSHQQDFVQSEDIHSRARLVALLPLVNLTSYPNAGRIVSDLLVTEVYANTEFELLEQTEMLERFKGNEDDLDDVLERAVALNVGSKLGVDTVIYGSVTEYRYKRGLDEDPVVGVNVRMLDVTSGEVLWAGSKSGVGGCFWFCEDSLNRLAQEVCHDLVTTMARVEEQDRQD